MKLRALREILAAHQEALSLRDWKITLRWAKRGEMDPDCSGHCYWLTEHTSATILVDRKEIDSEQIHTVLHELIHVRLEGHRDKPVKYDALYEQGINRITDALLAGRAEAALAAEAE